MITLHFTRQFTQGTLSGLTHQDYITFPVVSDAEHWLSAVKRAYQKKKLDYKVIEYRIEQ
jgi:hypothetical protein